MSAPQTNLETQERRHRGPIYGIIAVVAFALLLLFWLLMDTADNGTPADNNAAEIDDRTGDPTPTTPPADPAQPPVADPPATPDGDLPPADLPTPAPDIPAQPLPDGGTTTP